MPALPIWVGNLPHGAVSKQLRTRAYLTSLRARRRDPAENEQDSGAAKSSISFAALSVWRCVQWLTNPVRRFLEA